VISDATSTQLDILRGLDVGFSRTAGDVVTLQCPGAVPHLTFCADDGAKSLAIEACDRMFGKSFSSCLDVVSFLRCTDRVRGVYAI